MKKILFSMLCAFSINANAAETITDAFKNGKANIDMRYRYGFLKSDAATRKSYPSTLRTSLNFETDDYLGLSGRIKFVNVSVIGGERYNNSLNGQITRPLEPDPKDTVVEEVYAKLTTLPMIDLYYGRKELKHGNERFVSNLNWYQNHQTFDGVFLESFMYDSEFQFVYSRNINTIYTNKSTLGDRDGTFILTFMRNKTNPYMNFDFYSYLMKFSNPSFNIYSNKTIGANLSGHKMFDSGVDINYHAEYAYQEDFKNNPTSYNESYYRAKIGFNYINLEFAVDYEEFESDGVKAFQAPLGDGHSYNGWADVFLTNIPQTGGLKDLAFKFGYTIDHHELPDFINNTKLLVDRHSFKASKGSQAYGTEFDIAIVKPINDNMKFVTAYSQYEAKRFGSDQRKLWVLLTAKF